MAWDGDFAHERREDREVEREMRLLGFSQADVEAETRRRERARKEVRRGGQGTDGG